MAMQTGQQTVPLNERVHGPAPGGSTSDNASAETTAARGPAAEHAASQQASAQPQDGTTAPRVRPPGPGFELLFPHVEWKVPYAPSPLEGHPASDSIALCPGSSPVRKRRIPYVQPVDSPTEGDLGVSSAWGMEGMPAILMYAPERPLLSGAAGSTDAVPENLVLCVEEDAFERAWVAPQGYWGSVHARNGHA